VWQDVFLSLTLLRQLKLGLYVFVLYDVMRHNKSQAHLKSHCSHSIHLLGNSQNSPESAPLLLLPFKGKDFWVGLPPLMPLFAPVSVTCVWLQTYPSANWHLDVDRFWVSSWAEWSI